MTKTSWNWGSAEVPTERRAEGPDCPEENRMDSAGRGPRSRGPRHGKGTLVQPSSRSLEVSTREEWPNKRGVVLGGEGQVQPFAHSSGGSGSRALDPW